MAKPLYHDSCAALRECKIKGAHFRQLLSKVLGLELMDFKG